MQGRFGVRLNLSPVAAASLASRGNVIALVGELPGDLMTPVGAFLRLAADRSHAFLLESVEGGERIGRFSFLGFDPWAVISRKDFGEAQGNGDAGDRGHPEEPDRTGPTRGAISGGRTAWSGSPIDELRQAMAGFRQAPVPDLPPFTGGLVGNLAYDAVRAIERLPILARDDLRTPLVEAALYDTVVAFDRVRQRIQIIANLLPGRAGRSVEDEYGRARSRIESIAESLAGPLPPPSVGARARSEGRDPVRPSSGAGNLSCPSDLWQPGMLHAPGAEATARTGGEPESMQPRPEGTITETLGRGAFEDRVRRVLAEIARGEIFQLVLSRRIDRPFSGDAFSVYRALRAINPSPYNFFLRQGGRALVGASPEMLVRVREGRIETRPIAGTRPRGASEAEDVRFAAELAADAKERAEHLMLVDLGRNDVGRVSAPGQVTVRHFAEIERYSHVMHLVSSVEGVLRSGCDSFDALLACFPAGTVSGAPKVRAMELIETLEPTRRGPYAGAVFYRGFDGALDSAIAIRVVLLQEGMAHVQAGAGIVADSSPESEFFETEGKARAALEALDRAGAQP